MCEILKLNIDPDEIEKNTGIQWTLMEKEIRRRVWWSSRIHGDRKMCQMQGSVHNPLTSRIFEVLPNDVFELEGANLPSTTGSPLLPELDTQAQKLFLIIEKAIIFHENSVTKEDRNLVLQESKILYSKLMEWISDLPEWVHAVVSPSRVHAKKSPYSPKTSEFWRAWSLCLQYHSAILTLFRFILVDLCKRSTEKMPESDNNTIFSMTLNQVILAARGIIKFLNEIQLRYDPDFEQIDLVTLLVIQNVGTFLALLSRFAEKHNQREDAKHDFSFVRNLCLRISESGFNVYSELLKSMELLLTNSVDLCIEQLNCLITGYESLVKFDTNHGSDSLIPNIYPVTSSNLLSSTFIASQPFGNVNTISSQSFPMPQSQVFQPQMQSFQNRYPSSMLASFPSQFQNPTFPIAEQQSQSYDLYSTQFPNNYSENFTVNTNAGFSVQMMPVGIPNMNDTYNSQSFSRAENLQMLNTLFQ
ncbi:hypothetical protein HK096_010578 [Nowakowskiella sp. JEL0078]|nr:hypothetical protein HK096_010578 [Nowakowskiella sp. JEL0078]